MWLLSVLTFNSGEQVVTLSFLGCNLLHVLFMFSASRNPTTHHNKQKIKKNPKTVHTQKKQNDGYSYQKSIIHERH